MRSSLHVAMLRSPGEIDQPDDVFILLPDETLMNRFPGFAPITENDIPQGISMLIGTETGFAKRFPDSAEGVSYCRAHEPKHAYYRSRTPRCSSRCASKLIAPPHSRGRKRQRHRESLCNDCSTQAQRVAARVGHVPKRANGNDHRAGRPQ